LQTFLRSTENLLTRGGETMDAFFYFLNEEQKKKFLEMKRGTVEILKELKKRMRKQNIDIFSEDILKREEEMRKWISDVLTRRTKH
jgi:hypothetical protein